MKKLILLFGFCFALSSHGQSISSLPIEALEFRSILPTSDLHELDIVELERVAAVLTSTFEKLLRNEKLNDRPMTGGELFEMHFLINCYTKIVSSVSRKVDDFYTRGLKTADDHQLFARTNVRLGILSYTLARQFSESQKMVNILSYSDNSFDLKKREFLKILKHFSSKKFKKKTLNILGRLTSRVAEEIKNEELFKDTFTLENDLYNKLRLKIFKNKVFRTQRFALHHASGAFGNTSGAIRWRKGFLFKNDAIVNEIQDNLRPLDVITEKTSFALTDKFIPGHFGHNAIWLGTKEQLVEIGLWESQYIKPFHAQIESGFSIIETDRSGTHLKRLDDFMNVDEFAILRLNNLSNNYETYYQIALSQLGKKYDFNFDVESTDRLVCSELLYQTFSHVLWPTEKYLGRYTISPDNVVSLSLYQNSPLELVYYIAGKNKTEHLYKTIEELRRDISFDLSPDYQTVDFSIDPAQAISTKHQNDFYLLTWIRN